MIKKVILFIFLFLFILIKRCNAEELNLNAKSAILIEQSTGKIIYENNPDEKLNPASMTKIMSLIIIYDAINNGKLKLNDIVTISKEAASMGGTQVYINEGENYEVSELLKAVSIASANDAVYALAEKVGGTKDNFVNLMNEKAKELNLTNTNFVNPHGLDDENHYSSARDMSIMARELIKNESVLNYTSKYEDYFKKNDGSSIWLVNTNKLTRFYNGMDGLKTGYTEKAGYCLTATAKRNNLRLISVVMGEETIEKRSEDTLKLLNYGFNTIKKDVIMRKDKKIGEYKRDLTKKGKYDVYLNEDIVRVYDLNSSKTSFKFNIKFNNGKKLPIKNEESIGKIEITLNDGSKIVKNVYVHENIEKISFLSLIRKNIKLMTSGL